MFYMKYIFYCILLHFITATPQFNLYYTDSISKSDNALQYNCLRTVTSIREVDIGWRFNYTNLKINAINHQITSYCMNEFSFKYRGQEKTGHFPNFTFYELSKQGISSEQLYLWSAPIELVEEYQSYLNQLLTFNDLSLGKKIFYNCTLPRFGSHCQYEFDYYNHSNQSSLSGIINEYYTTNEYDPTSLTCYEHLQCYRGLESVCLDWSDICDGKIDCFDHGQDEEHCWQLEINECTDDQYRCDNGQCIPETFYQDGKIIFDCIDMSDEALVGTQVKISNLCHKSEPTFACEDRICKESFLTKLLPINGSKTDETDCEQWECDNIYTHCDGNWNCRYGEDEIGCDELSRSMCSLNEHLCVSPSTYRFICLHISKVRDGNLDCVAGTDEPIRHIHPMQQNSLVRYTNNFLCMNQTKSPPMAPFMLCNGQPMCDHKDDEKFCETNVATMNVRGICLSGNIGYATQVEKFLCGFVSDKYKRRIIHLKLDNTISPVEKINENVVSSSLSPMKISPKISRQLKFGCHRGLRLRVWLNNKSDLITNPVCFCPPSYYGDDCQYQNQRISLVIKFRAPSDSWRTQFAIIISLIDDSDDRIIHSYEQIMYLSWNNCYTKFQIYLLYSTRSKDLTKNYSIHIDIYEIKTLAHRGSLLLPILFPFLPVHRLAFIVNIPRTTNIENQICAKQSCVHGECVKYENIPEKSFCRCHEGWSGRYCTIQHTCMCSFGSLCIGITANNRSICVCPLNKFGPRCLLTDTICQINNENKCQNGGECIAINRHIIFNKEFVCVCPTGYSGDRCNITDNELNLSFNKDIILSQDILFHFIQVSGNATHNRSTTFRKILIREDTISITWSKPFHIVFIELDKTYYLVMYQKTYIQSKVTKKIINPSDHCPHINEIFKEKFNGTFPQWHPIRRIKYYHIPCLNQSLNLSCFYDTDQFCLCYQFGQKRLANCFAFNHSMIFNCQGQSECDRGQCFEDEQECPTRSICKCDSCYFGQRCHLTTDGYGLSLDVILGYRISPHASINHQPLIIKISLALTIIFIITGLINGILSLITFMNKTLWQVGCGLYLLTSSTTTLFITIMFGLKFFILLLSHMSIISNRSFLLGQCYSFDYILRIFISIDQWLNACIAIERTTAVIKGVSFDKNKSKKTAKLMITILFITVAVSYIHDPIHRHIIDEVNQDDSRQNRIWCIMKY
ncbi:unnamed protein product, partial [Adineta steineri]